MPGTQVVEILDSIREVHRQLADRYGELDQAATDERIRLLLEDMQRREQQFDQAVAEYESTTPRPILETELESVPEPALHVERLRERLVQPRTLEELVEETLLLNSTLCDAYLTLAREAPLPEVRELFQNLARLEERNDCQYARAILDACR
jgi:rubrerythrin